MSVKVKFEDFLNDVVSSEEDSNLAKVCNIILDNFDDVLIKKSSYGSRTTFIAEILQKHWSSTPKFLKYTPEKDLKKVNPLQRIKSLNVGPFRGFKENEEIDLDSDHVLIYGPNGTGKTSFCEALEYGLLGYVSEAERKRFKKQEEYLKNAHADKFKSPILVGRYGIDDEKEININDELFRYCFIEKNRIDSFSLMAAQSPAKQTEIIATLFGLDEFNDFVSNFSNTIDEKYIDIIGIKGQKLEKKSESLKFQQQIIKTRQQAIDEYTLELESILLKLKKGCLGKTKEFLTSRIEEINKQSVTTKESLIPVDEIRHLVEGIKEIYEDFKSLRDTFAGLTDQISYKNLYESIISLSDDLNTCPACLTPLNQVVENPWGHANSELENLKEAASLENELISKKADLNEKLKSFNNFLIQFELQDYSCRVKNENDLILWWELLAIPTEDDETISPKLQLILEGLSAKYQKQTRIQSSIDDELITEKQALEKSKKEIERINNNIEENQNQIAKATANIKKFDVENSKLISEVEIEKSIVKTNLEIVDSYSIFVEKLKTYKDNLPSQLIEDLGDNVVKLYNSFNRNDGVHELISSIELPVKAGDQINIYFQDNKTKAHDALHVLSEGHIRCIGLAILLAKNIKEESPLLIFDDPVNAIDDDHRESIRKTLFDDGLFDNKQIVLACHGEEFYKDVQNLLGPNIVKKAKCITFLPRQTDNHIRIETNKSPRCYLLLAKSNIDSLKKRDALSNSRRALESLSKDKLWKYVNKHGDGNLSIKMRSSKSEIELRNLCDQLKSKIKKDDFSDVNKNRILKPLESILGQSGSSREWRYLNKGTHEELNRAEFDLCTVREMVNSLIEIDGYLRNDKNYS